MDSLGSGFAIALVLLGIVIAVLWVLLPFAVFGIKDLARTIIEQQRASNKLLERLAAQGDKRN